MRISPFLAFLASVFLTSTLSAQTTIENFGFEADWDGWTDIDPDDGETAISENFHSGSKSAKITGTNGRFEQSVTVDPQSEYELRAHIRGSGLIGLKIGGETFTKSSTDDSDKWLPISLSFNTQEAKEAIVFGAYHEGEGRFDDFELALISSNANGLVASNDLSNQALEDPVIRILGSDLSSELSFILQDVANVTSEESDIRVLSISGDGSLKNLNDLLYLRGIDAAVVQSDVLSYYRDRSAVRRIEGKLVYLAKLGTTVGHFLAGKSNATIQDLNGKRVYMGDSESASFITASNIFDRLGISVTPVDDLDPQEALASLKAGEIDAGFWMDVPPVGILHLAQPAEDLHFLHIPTQGIDPDIYGLRNLTSEDYPLIPVEEDVQTVTAEIALIAYNWPSDHNRYNKMKRFTEVLAEKTEMLHNGNYHRSLRTADFFSEVSAGWKYFE